MVSIGFKAVYLLLALFALPQVVAAPGAAALSSRDLFPVPDWEKREALLAFNKIRSKYKLPHLVWDDYLEIFAAEKASSCKDEDGIRYGTSSNGLSPFTENTNVRTYRERSSCKHHTGGDQNLVFTE